MTIDSLPLGGQHCEAIDRHEDIAVGDRITFGSVRHEPGRSVPIALTGTVRAMYLEKHPNTLHWRPEGAVFAEVELADGELGRCWFTRDKPYLAGDLDGLAGAAPEGALF